MQIMRTENAKSITVYLCAPWWLVQEHITQYNGMQKEDLTYANQA